MTTVLQPLPVPSFVWSADGRLGPDALSKARDLPQLLGSAQGQFAVHAVSDGEHVLARDLLGVNKLFVALDPTGTLRSSNYAIELVRGGLPLRSIQSVPAGHTLVVDAGQRTWQLQRGQGLTFGGPSTLGEELGDAALANRGRRIRARLEETFARLAEVLRGHRIYVTLSGGLDSTTIAVLARRWFGEVTALTFAIDAPTRPPSEDLAYAERVAQALDLQFMRVSRTPQQVLGLLDEALVRGQDWREFNVHCALVNAALARALADGAGDSPIPLSVLTGDVMNELMADYSPVHYRGRELYALPRLPPGRLRRFLVGGLDAGDREVGIFAQRGINAIQPYAWCADAYSALPEDWLGLEGTKQRLVRAVMGDEVPDFVYERPKVRAQAGSAEPSGTLAVLVDEGIDEAWLLRRFAQLFEAEERDVQDFVRAGIYRFKTTFPE